MRVRTKLGLGFAVMAGVALLCCWGGYRGMQGLSESLRYVTGPAWEAADGAMESSIGLEAQMLVVDRLVSRGRAEEEVELQARFKQAVDFAAEAFQRCGKSGLFEPQEVARLQGKVNDYETARTQLLAEHATYATADLDLARSLKTFQDVITAAEGVGDAQLEVLAQQPDQQISWNSGLRERWTAADGAMMAQIALLERAYYYQRLTSGIDDAQAASANLERSLKKLRVHIDEIVPLPAFNVPAPGQAGSYAAYFPRAVDENERLMVEALKCHARLRASQERYRSVADDLLKTLESFEEVGDSKVEGQVKEIEAARKASLELILGVVALSLLLGTAVTWVIARDVVGRLERLDDVAREVAKGDLDQRIETVHEDELGQLSKSFSTLLETLRDYVGRSRQVSREVGSVAAEINAAVKAQSQALTGQASAVAQATSSLEELKANALTNDERAREVLGTTKGTVQGMAGVQEQVGEIATSILALSEKVQQIGEILDSVSDIADQSNLLALNASIEASKAGEYGRGFEVVATEVRSLAQQSQKATHSIRAMLRDIQRAMSAAVMKTEEGTKRVEGQASELGVAIQSVEQIVYATREQTRAIEQIADAVAAVSGNIGQSQASSAQVADATGGLVQQAELLRSAIERFAVQRA